MYTIAVVVLMAMASIEAAPGHMRKYYHHPSPYYYRPAPAVYYKPYNPHHSQQPAAEEAPAVDVRNNELGDVVDVAVGAGSFTTLVKIVSDLGLVDTLKGAEALTVFAPSDDAFAKLPEGTLESLSPEAAKEIVLRHVVTAKVPAAAVQTGTVGTIGGENIDLVKTAEGGVQIVYNGNTVNVVAADVMASNGVIHVIDSVIL